MYSQLSVCIPLFVLAMFFSGMQIYTIFNNIFPDLPSPFIVFISLLFGFFMTGCSTINDIPPENWDAAFWSIYH